ncbi:metallophosphoesterase [Paenibacillus mendelii]|uniref:Metallophosphoesterase n=1 Tax=Paenibacillus mendelii TaxID=206163 RepID=A0ABV6JC94_9BACL|nr:metallophosphoesterase [Paenibacillus mendelii]MCQ6559587.1 metallophosphoesterase [Paenibacillus mendelii]
MMSVRTLVSAAIFLGLFLGLNLLIGWNGSLFWGAVLPPAFMTLYWILYGIIALSYLAAMILRRVLPYQLYTWFKLIGAYGMAFLFYSLLLVPAGNLAAWLLRLAGMDAEATVLLVGWFVVSLLLLLLLRGSANAWRPIVRRYDITIDKQAGAFRELRIAAASDLHLGTIVGKRHLRRLVHIVDELSPDLVLLPGDVLDDSIEPFVRENMAEVMQELKAPLGVYASLGNHEYYGGHITEYIERMRAIGIEVLVDRTVHVDDSFYVAGRADKAAEGLEPGRLPIASLLHDLDRSQPVIVLDHQPYGYRLAAEAGADLILSGHTHRGQMAPNHWITRRLFDLDWGYLQINKLHAIVSSGFGTWGPPIRIGSRSEVLDIHITFRSPAEG